MLSNWFVKKTNAHPPPPSVPVRAMSRIQHAFMAAQNAGLSPDRIELTMADFESFIREGGSLRYAGCPVSLGPSSRLGGRRKRGKYEFACREWVAL